jgi:hypothetical protein
MRTGNLNSTFEKADSPPSVSDFEKKYRNRLKIFEFFTESQAAS